MNISAGKPFREIHMVLLSVLVSVPFAGAADAPQYPDKTNLMVYVNNSGQSQAVKTVQEWSVRRAHILSNMQLVMGDLPSSTNKVPLDIKVIAEVQVGKVMRKKISFATQKNDRAPAYLLIPPDLKGKAPAMLCLHQTVDSGKGEPAGLDGNPNLHYALELAERGYVTLAPDFPGFAEYPCDIYGMGYVSGMMKGIWNNMRAVDLLQSLPEVDTERIGCIGHSLGGHNTLFVSAFDARIKAAVTSCGFTSFAKYFGGDLSGWCSPRYMPRIMNVYGKDAKRMPFDFSEVLAAIAPRPVFINAPMGDGNFAVAGVTDCVAAARPVYELLGARDNLAVMNPDAGHDFPPTVREAAYAFLDKVLKAK